MTPCCPRCPDSALLTWGTHGVWVLYCARCWGIWVDHASVRQAAGVAIDGATAAHGEPMVCPICRSPLRAWDTGGVVIDRCDAHGVWFDRAELDQLVERARQPSSRGHGAFIAGGVGVAAGAAMIAGSAGSQRPQNSSPLEVAGESVDAVAEAMPVVDSAGELADGAVELAFGAGDVVVVVAENAADAASVVAESAAGALGGVSEAFGAIFDFFS